MNYQLTQTGSITLLLEDGSVLFLPSEDNGTPEWFAYKKWLEQGNTPLPAPEPPTFTTEEKLNAAGLTVAELKNLFGLT